VPLIANRKIRHFLRRRSQAGEASNPTTDVAYGGAAW
jgi:hypothetical protein